MYFIQSIRIRLLRFLLQTLLTFIPIIYTSKTFLFYYSSLKKFSIPNKIKQHLNSSKHSSMNKTLGQRFFHLIQKEKKLKPSTSATNLPTISINQLEKQLNTFKKKKYLKQNADDSAILNHKELNVCSPFYDRMKTHKQNCKCPFHRKQRFSVIPVKRSQKSGFIMKKSVQKLKHEEQKQRQKPFSSKQVIRQSKKKTINKSLDNLEEGTQFCHSQNIIINPKVQTRNYSYENFLKECEFHLLRKKGFAIGKPEHVVRKGLKQIFEFIKSHLDYSVEKMTEWINSVQKDKDYGDFYIERFKEMKKNYEIALKKKKQKLLHSQDDTDSVSNNRFQRTFNSTFGNSFLNKSKQGVSGLQDKRNRRYKSVNHGVIAGEQQARKANGFDGLRRLINASEDWDLTQDQISQMFVNKLLEELTQQSTISNQTSQDIMGLGLDQFKKVFNTIQKNILSDKYSEQVLLKLQSGVLNQLIKKYSQDTTNSQQPLTSTIQENNAIGQIKDVTEEVFGLQRNLAITQIPKTEGIADLKSKLDIVKQTQNIIKKYRLRKLSKISNISKISNLSNQQERNLLNATSTSKNYKGGKRNTPNGQKSKSMNIHSHSKKSSNADSSLAGSDQNIDPLTGRKIILNTKGSGEQLSDQSDIDDQNETDPHKRIKKFKNLGPNARRSKLMKNGEMFKFLDGFAQDDHDNYEDLYRKSMEQRKVYHTKAEKYLFDINMGKTIIKNDDSIFTAKRKMRVIKQLLQQSPHAPEADTLQNYVKQIEHKIQLKIQKDKKLKEQTNFPQPEQIHEKDVWKMVSLDNLGFDLIFYDLTSKIKTEDNEDLCILLNEWRLHNMRNLEQQLSFKINLLTDSDQIRKSNKNSKIDDVLVQDAMRNMQFQPQIQSVYQFNVKNDSKTTKKQSNPANFVQPSQFNSFWSQNSFNQSFTREFIQGLDDEQRKDYLKKIKQMFKYAKIHFPDTFEMYLKNISSSHTSINSEESEINISGLPFQNY